MQTIMDRLRQRRQESGDQTGMTLIECLIVIVILGILGSAVVFAIQNVTTSSARSACAGDYRTVETAVVTYKSQVGTYPQASDAGGIDYAAPIVMPPGDLVGTLLTRQANGSGPWLSSFPGNHGHYQIAVMPDGTVSVYETDGTTGTGAVQPTLVVTGCRRVT